MNLNAELTKREREIAELLAWGAAKKEVAGMLYISVRTVENTARSIYEKTGVSKATELSVWWFCTKCGVPVSIDPLKRAFIAGILLAILIPREITGAGDMFRIGRAKITTIARARRRVKTGCTDFLDWIEE